MQGLSKHWEERRVVPFGPPRSQHGSSMNARMATSAPMLAAALKALSETTDARGLSLALETLSRDVTAGSTVTYHLEMLAWTFRGDPAARALVWLSRDAAALEQRD